MAGDIVTHYCLRFHRGVVYIVVAGNIVDHYCLGIDIGVVCIIVAYYNIDHLCLTEEWFILLWLVILLHITV